MYSYLLYRVFLFNVVLDLIHKIFQGGIISKELWLPLLTVAFFILEGIWNKKIMNWKQVSDVKLAVFQKMN